jgi:crotonobetainyl-CoA:carnitine CoA-transferase CaiB-like acyl-CoA transferase
VTSALDGVRVVDLTAGVAGPVAGMLLADLGADVVKIYPPGGGPSSAEPGLHMWDRGKRSAALDPARPADLAALDRLIGAADIVLVGTPEHGADYPGVGYEDLRARGHSPGNPAFWIAMPPYLLGETPWAGQQESAGLLSAWLGLAWNQASYDDVPVDCIFPLALHMQGIWAAIIAVALLVARQRGRPVAPLAVAGGAHGGQLVSPGGFAAGLAEPHVHRPGGPGGALPNYRCYRCGDGQWLFFGAFTTAFIERGFRAVGAAWILQDPRVAGNPDRVRLPRNLGWITRELEEVFQGRTRADWLGLLDAADVPAAAVGRSADWLDHEQVRAIGLRAAARNDAGQSIVMPGPLIGLSQTPVTAGHSAQTRYPAVADLRVGWSPAAAPRGREPAATEPPLAGLRVLNLGTIIAGPYAATLLGELGADVLKIERPPRGDEFRVAHGGRGGAGFSVYNRDQRSLLLDLTSDEGSGVFLRLVRSADVVVDNYRVGVLRRLGIDHDQLAAVNPAVTSVSISAFGDTGALSQRPGFDPVIQAMSGIMRSQGGPDEADSPVFLTAPVNDVLAAGLGALGACAALHARERIGRGQLVSVTLCASSCLVQSEYLVRFAGAPPMPTGGRDFAGGHPLDRLYRGADGWVRLGGRQLPDLAGLARAGLAAPGSLPTPAPPTTAPPTTASPTTASPTDLPAITAAIAAAVARLPVSQILRRAAAAGIPAVRARQAQDLIADEQLIRHGLLTVVERDDSGVAQVGPGRWLEMPGLVTPPPGPAPAPGEHGQAILVEVGAAPR